MEVTRPVKVAAASGSRGRTGVVLPAGDLTFLFTDIVGSTHLFVEHGQRWSEVMAEHDRLLIDAVESAGGTFVKTVGDAVLGAFREPSAAIAAAVTGQHRMRSHHWPQGLEPIVRMGLHRGHAEPDGADYRSVAVHLASRVVGAANGGQILLTDAVAKHGAAPDGCRLVRCSPVRLRGFDDPQMLWTVDGPGLIGAATPPRAPGVLQLAGLSRADIVGRDMDVRTIEKALSRHRLVTIAGPGGVGKSRVAVEVAASASSAGEGGTWFVDLGAVAEASEVAPAVALALHLAPAQGTPAVLAVVERLQQDGNLVVLDCCERLLAPVATLVDDLLQAAAGLRVLTTSREPLRLPGEHVVRLRPLQVPDDDELEALGPAAWEEVAALRLFAARADEARPELVLGSADLPAVAAIVRAVDGLPLGIELAAARTRILSPGQIAERLEERFRLLRGGHRTAPDRHRDLRALIEWSVDLLDPGARDLLCALGAFIGPVSLETLSVVSGGDPLELVEALDKLAEASLVSTDERGLVTVLDTTREWAAGALDRRADAKAVRQRLFDHVLECSTADPRAAASDLPNLLGAARWAVSHDPVAAVRLVALVAEDLIRVGADVHLLELAQALEAAGAPADQNDRARVLVAAAGAAFLRYDGAAVEDLCRRAIGAADQVEAHDVAAEAWKLLAGACQLTGDMDAVPERFAEARRAAERSGRRDVLAEVDFSAAVVERPRPSEMVTVLTGVLDTVVSLGVAADVKVHLAVALAALDRYDECVTLLDEVIVAPPAEVPLHVRLDALIARARVSSSLGRFADSDADLATAERSARRSGSAVHLARIHDLRAASAYAVADLDGYSRHITQVLGFCERHARYSLQALHAAIAARLTRIGDVQGVRRELDLAAATAPESASSDVFGETFARGWLASQTTDEPGAADDAFARAAALADESEMPTGLLDVAGAAAAHAAKHGRHDRAASWLRRGRALRRASRGFLDSAAIALARVDTDDARAVAARLVATADAWPEGPTTARFAHEEDRVQSIRRSDAVGVDRDRSGDLLDEAIAILEEASTPTIRS